MFGFRAAAAAAVAMALSAAGIRAETFRPSRHRGAPTLYQRSGYTAWRRGKTNKYKPAATDRGFAIRNVTGKRPPAHIIRAIAANKAVLCA